MDTKESMNQSTKLHGVFYSLTVVLYVLFVYFSTVKPIGESCDSDTECGSEALCKAQTVHEGAPKCSKF